MTTPNFNKISDKAPQEFASKPLPIEEDFNIITETGSKYVLKRINHKWFIDMDGNEYEVVGFANLPYHPKQFVNRPPEDRLGYKIIPDPAPGKYVIFNRNPERYGHTSRLKEFHHA